MAINVNFVKTSVELISNKVQSTGQITINDLNNAFKIAQLDEVKAQMSTYEEGIMTSDNLSDLKVTKSIQVSSTGFATEPSNYFYFSSARVKYYVDNVPYEADIDIIKETELGLRFNSQINPISKRFPVMLLRSGGFQVYPTDIESVVLTYIKEPSDPVWAYTTLNGRPVYDSANSTDFELPSDQATDIIYRVCQILGIRIRRQDLVQYGIVKEQETSQ